MPHMTRTSPHRHDVSDSPDGHARTTVPVLTRDIGLAERALRALLDRQLDKAGLSFPAWTVLVFLDGSDSRTRSALVGRQIDGHVVPTAAAAEETIDDLLAAGLLVPVTEAVNASGEAGNLDVVGDDRPLARSAVADAIYRPVRDAVARITHVLHDDLSADDIETTRRTLGEIARRANTILAIAEGPSATD